MQQGVRDQVGLLTKDMFDDIILNMPIETKFLMFPMNHSKAVGDKGGYHYTLLVLNLPTVCWTHYNTMLPRSAKYMKKPVDHYYKEAQEMVCLKIFITLSLHSNDTNIGFNLIYIKESCDETIGCSEIFEGEGHEGN